MSTLKDFNKKVVLTKEQFAARLAAGSLVEGVEYEISNYEEPVQDVRVNGTTIVSNGVGNFTVINNTTSTSTVEALAANQGRVLQEQINALNKGSFLALWDCVTGLPTTPMPATPYTYKVGDFYRVASIASGRYLHTIHMEGYCSSQTTTPYSLDFAFETDSGDEMGTVSEIIAYLGVEGYIDRNSLTATGTVGDLQVGGIAASSDYPDVIIINSAEATNIGQLTDADTITDNVTGGGTANYKPDGTTYTGTASTVEETDATVEVGRVYYYDGINWRFETANKGARDVQVNGVTTVDANGVAHLTVVDNLASTATNSALSANQGRVLNSALSGKASLVNGKVPLEQLPTFITDTVEEYPTYSDFPATGKNGIIYVAKDTNKSYRWLGTAYTEISNQAAFYSISPTDSITNMGQLREYVTNVNSTGMHCFFDMHSYVTDAYVCTIHMYTIDHTNYCQILDLLGHTVYFCEDGYADDTLIIDYCSEPGNKWMSPRDVQVNGVSALNGEIVNITDSMLEDVKYTTQTLSEAQKAQARANINAGVPTAITFLGADE